MLDPRTWLEQAKQLDVGEKQRIQHDCGEGNSLLIERKPDGYSAWCHRCAEPGWVPVKEMSVSERLAIRAAQQAADASVERALTLPQPAEFDLAKWPLRYRVWLYKGGLLNTDIEDLALYYHEPTDRLVIPVFRDGRLVYWQARSEDKGKPKYLNPSVDRASVYGWFPQQEPLSPEPIVLTEDYLSAYRVHKATGIRTCALFGVRVPDYLLTKLMQSPDVIVWLDPDWGVPNCPGQRAATEIMRRLRAYGIPCRNILSRADPKKLSKQEILEALNANS